jgi:beta-glucanase (GH16 family)
VTALVLLLAAAQPAGPERFAAEIRAFEEADLKAPPAPGGVLFVGSSTVRMWKTREAFPDLAPINRGFGGSQFADATHYADRIVWPYRPRAVVVYSGDNDVAAGRSPERVAEDAAAFVARVRERLPETRILILSIKPSVKRWALWPKMKEANARIRAMCLDAPRLRFLDAAAPMIEAGEPPPADLFVDDGLHLSPKGYAILNRVVGEALAGEPFQTTPLVEEFDGPALDPARWRVAFRQWGGADANGGVLPQNVSLKDGTLVLEVHGDRYAGPLKGINADGSERADGRRTGAAIATRAQFGSGRFEARLKAAPVLGACSALWTFYYLERQTGEPENHEIDIELPGRPGEAHRGFSFDRALCNTFRTPERRVTVGYTKLAAAQDDGRFHTYRFDWHTGGKPRVEFFVDGAPVRTIETNVPDRAGRLWVGVWCPRSFAGPADFDTARMVVDWIRITPFGEAGDRFVEEPLDPRHWAR